MMGYAPYRVENIVGKGENTGYTIRQKMPIRSS